MTTSSMCSARSLAERCCRSKQASRCCAAPRASKGVIADHSAYSEHLGEELSAAFRETAAVADNDQARESAEHLAGVYGKDRYVAASERRRTRRQAIANRLRELDAIDDSAEVADLEQEENHL